VAAIANLRMTDPSETTDPQPTQLYKLAAQSSVPFLGSARLDWEDPTGPRSRPLTKSAVLGSSENAEIVLGDPTISRLHAELAFRDDGVWLRDLGSSNGSWVNGVRVERALVPHLGRIRIGTTDLILTHVRRGPPPELAADDWAEPRFHGLEGGSRKMRALYGTLARVAAAEAPVLVLGETGTGKEVVARALHESSARKGGPFVVVDCAALPENLLEAELFGHARGAFSGAVGARAGAIEAANHGTVFLDEIGELPLDVQPKLLRVLETREFRRVGGNRTLQTNVRVIAATKRDLQREVGAGKFREDLYFRLAVVPVTVPPLRARREDIPFLVQNMLKSSSGDALSVPPETMQSLAAHEWPGNVRELRNVLERSVYMAQATGATELGVVTLPTAHTTSDAAFHFEPDKSYRETRAKYDGEFERRYVKWLLGRHNGNISAAAREAKMDRKHLHDMAKKHGLRGNEAEE
jgi:transcriptional regulator with GAF, ATPase, and Fis domain